MAERDPDELFRRFVRDHEVRALGELFDLAAPQLARVAWHLAHDAEAVEDLVQATFLTALDAGRPFEPERRVMPWLLGILTNHARNLRRAAARQPDSLATEPSHTKTADSALEYRELRDAVDRAVADLPAIYRTVVTSWLLDGEQPTEIARREGRPATTVRVQLHRGLQLLRNALPAGMAALAASSVLSPEASARVKEQVLARATAMSPPVAAGIATAIGGIVMAKWLVASAVVLAIAAGISWFAGREGDVEPSAFVPANEPGEALEVIDRPQLELVVDQRSEVSEPRAVADAEPSDPLRGWWLIAKANGVTSAETARISSELRVVDASAVEDEVGNSALPTPLTFERDVAGPHFEIDVSELFADAEHAPRSLVVRYDHPRYVPTFAQIDVGAQVDLATAFSKERVELHIEFAPLPAELIVEGRVAGSAPVAPAEIVVALFHFDAQGRIERRATEHARCDSDGSFRLRSPNSGAHAFAAVHQGWRPATRLIAADVHGVVDLGEIALDRGEHIAGIARVRPSTRWRVSSLHARLPEAQALYAFDSRRTGEAPAPEDVVQLCWLNQRFELGWAKAEVDVAGAFRVDGLAPDTYELAGSMDQVEETASIKSLAMFSPESDREVRASADGVVLDLHCDGLRLDIRAAGRPIDGTRISLKSSSGECSGGAIGSQIDLAWNSDDAPLVRIEKEGFAPFEFRAVASDEVRIVELSLAHGVVELVLVPQFSCTPPATFNVSLNPLGDPATHGHSYTAVFRAEEPDWRFNDVPPGRYQIFVSIGNAAADTTCVMTSIEHELVSGTMRVPLLFQAGGNFALEVHGGGNVPQRLTLVDSDDREVYAYLVYFDAQIGREQTTVSPQFSVPTDVRVETQRALVPGEYSLLLRTKLGEPAVRHRFRIVAGETTELDIEVPSEQR